MKPIEDIFEDEFTSFLIKTDKRTSFKERFGENIARCGIAGIPLLLIENFKHLGMNHSEFHLACLILARRHSTKHPYFSLNKLSRSYRFSQDTLHRAKNGLIEKGYLIIFEKKENGRGYGRNYYNINGLLKALDDIARENLSEKE